MQILFAISILCSLTVVWAGIAVVRNIRSSRKQKSTSAPAQHDFAYHLFSASDDVEPRSVTPQSISDITAKKSWNRPPDLVTVRPRPEHRSPINRYVAESLEGRRKLPQAAHPSSDRLDWAYFNKDSGDLTDPYESPRIQANSRNSLRRN
jgi:hypothetical protein